MSSLSNNSSGAGSRNGSPNGPRKPAVMKKVVAKIAKATIKKMVPIQVYRDCADILTKALYHDKDAMEEHKKRKRVLNSRQLGYSTPAAKNMIQSDSVNLLQLSTEESSTYHGKEPPQLRLPGSVRNKKLDPVI